MQDHAVDTPEILATARPSMGRRLIGLAALVGLGLMLLQAAVTQPLDAGWRIAMILVGVAFIAVAEIMRRATASWIELTAEVLRDADGTEIVRIDEIDRIDQGYFALKPSNGFLLRVRQSQPRGWRLGLWWRLGRRIGVGGMTPARETKLIAEIINARLLER